MFDKIPFAEFKKYLQIEKERQLALQEVSEVLGIDIDKNKGGQVYLFIILVRF